jgi:hypothetical protein
MVGKLKNTYLAVAAVLALAVPIMASAQTASGQTTYKISMEETTPLSLPGYYQATLKLTVGSDGIVQGWYFPDDSGPAISVSGSNLNGKYWLSFDNGNFQIDAAAQPDGRLVGSAERVLPATSAFPRTFSFVATPSSG